MKHEAMSHAKFSHFQIFCCFLVNRNATYITNRQYRIFLKAIHKYINIGQHLGVKPKISRVYLKLLIILINKLFSIKLPLYIIFDGRLALPAVSF
jgi:hypothetical protein